MKNIKNLLLQKLPENITELLISSGRCADDMGFKAFIVGGLVRDLFLNYENHDIDLVVEGEGIRFAEVLAREYGASICCYESFGTAALTFSDGYKLDVATARTEIYEHPSALPKVRPGLIRDDMYRRDFTINALAVGLNPDHFGKLLDFFNARKDIKRKLIRVMHDLSFIDDPTRAFRAVRFEQRFGFRIVKSTEKLIKNLVEGDLFTKLADYRISSELQLILREKDPLPALKRLEELGVLGRIRPRAANNRGIKRLLDKIESVSPA
ncbi:MAG: hypothetical protein Q7J27_02540 [Syntrophales bacterium]|nr:hypothetical protein [Syntrophales bacterium]